jgi:TPR repeat protein
MWRFLGAGLLAMLASPILAAATPIAGNAVLDAGLGAYAAGDYGAARSVLRPLADRGSAIAETMMGAMAAKGQGRPADPAAAVGWWLRAANRGYPPAQLALAKALARGQGVAVDTGKAWVWARLAASAGNGTAVEATALADGLGRGFGADRLAELEAERAEWRPWP